MQRRVARLINLVVVMLMSAEIIGASITATRATCGYAVNIVAEESGASLVGSVLFEKAEEENEKTEEENGHVTRALLIDFARIALSLSAHHSPQCDHRETTFGDRSKSAVHKFNCVFLI
ncbi:MAG TPA: hypothetical protein VGD65_24165 [Chryseosolibacter sp.]